MITLATPEWSLILDDDMLTWTPIEGEGDTIPSMAIARVETDGPRITIHYLCGRQLLRLEAPESDASQVAAIAAVIAAQASIDQGCITPRERRRIAALPGPTGAVLYDRWAA